MANVVTLEHLANGISKVILHDETHKNTFSKDLISGIQQAFQEIAAQDSCKVVVIHGYDNYFCCGGTREELLAIYRGETNFNDLDFFTALLDCPVPCISAMQGHALGGGLAFGCYADLLVLGESAFYAANFMKYGFTPGMGATYIIPYKFGRVLGEELLFTAANYQGKQLAARGVGAQVVANDEVIAQAMQLARSLADKPRLSLVTLKQQTTAHLRTHLPECIAQEISMHDTTFHQAEVQQRIQALFGK